MGGGSGSLFVTEGAKGRSGYKLYASSVLVCVCLIWLYRATHVPARSEDGRWAWMGLFAAELWFGFYWLLTQSVRWNPIYRRTFKDNLPLRCTQVEEDADHAIFQCPRAMDVWRAMCFPFESPRSISEWRHRCGALDRAPEDSAKVKSLMMYTCWSIWLDRNREIFEGSKTPPFIIARACRAQVTELFEANANLVLQEARFETFQIGWKPPVNQEFKLNFDGALKHGSGTAGCGFIIRDWIGRIWAAGAIPIASSSVVDIEIRALWEGLKMAETLPRVTRLWIEGDSATVIQWINVGSKDHYLCRDIMQRTRRFSYVRVSHTYREGNQAADLLASMATALEGPQVWHYNFPIDLVMVAIRDMLGGTLDRRIRIFGTELPGVDVFVCTADPDAEPPSLVVSTILSLMSYDYPPEKLSVYLSDDAGSELTFYALCEASRFAKHWLPFCKRFNVEPRSPSAYFSKSCDPLNACNPKEWTSMKNLYEGMKNRIDSVVALGKIPQELKEHKGFSEWNSGITSKNHQSIVQILIDGRDQGEVDLEGNLLPTLVYMAREKRPQHHHNFKAGAMNSLIRVSAEISNGPIILNLDCDMYSNNSESIRDALCFLLDEENGQDIGFVQYPQYFDNITKNDLYSSSFNVVNEVEFPGLDSWGGPMYIGTGCFHRRESLCGRKYSSDYKEDWKRGIERKVEESVCILEERAKALASCTYEHNTLWGNEIGLKYGCPVEDILTGLLIHSRGWRSIYFNPSRRGFLGLAPTSLAQMLVQHKRWTEGHFQMFLSKYCPFIQGGHGRMKLGLLMGYSIYNLWAANSIPTLYYLVIPPLCLFKGISLFPKVSSPWFIPFAYVIIAKHTYSLIESLTFGDTLIGWWNSQRIWMLKRVTAYFFGFIDTIFKLVGISKIAFAITTKVTDGDVSKRYEDEVMEFGASSSMFVVIATLALLNLLCFVGGVKRMVVDEVVRVLDPLMLQLVLCGLVVIINLPVYEGLFLRKDKGSIPSSVTFASFGLAMLACLLPIV